MKIAKKHLFHGGRGDVDVNCCELTRVFREEILNVLPHPGSLLLFGEERESGSGV